ncbi:DUF2062 domain-containing protein [Chitinibacter bivalviorum]|uniref:DUF2062 domain-containing protein n=1 Tax=Chitinibacter bivalviorum TaxID=2739434 RepID=A0A7H9BHG3_9NEIS|nr:DUF2062 domain-containing protein [Chitinibacter bivalviorum]QLG88077.1 DUF2062 domain-containing protein [Chitinibacter bivalviorum]
MPRKLLRRWLPDQSTLQKNRFLNRFSHWFEHPNLWHLNRRSVAGGVAVGMIGGLIPGPLQVITASVLALIFRVNLPVAIFATFYTNPFTIAPIYWVAFWLGSWVTGQNGSATMAQMPSFMDLALLDWVAEMGSWVQSLGMPLLVGLPLLSVLLAIVSYFMVQLCWRIWVYWAIHLRSKRPRANT